MRSFFCFLFLVILSACGKKTDPVLEEPFQLAKTFEKDPSAANAEKFFDSAITLLQGGLLKPESKLELLHKCQAVSIQAQLPARTALFTSTLIKEDPQNTNFKSWCADLVQALQGLQKQEAAQSFVLAFASAFPGDNQLADFQKSGLSPNVKSIDEQIEYFASAMFSDSTHQFNENLATNFIDACEALAMVHPKHPKAVDYLFKAATTSRSIRSYPKAIAIYDWIIRSFDNNNQASQASFFKAFTVDNDLKDVQQAKALYADFLKKYPNDEFADDAKFLMDNLGKSDEEILESLKKNQAQ